MSRNWKRSVTVYLTESEYQLITGKASQLETSSSSFTKQALLIYYIKHIEKHLKNAEPIAA
ncbi:MULTISPECIES: hypothetical protein [unclassified Microcoleus]|uniref:hypothetical protein n=1 Tax=unclassified Microcoleus TaxID=2642155 RepID=UPI002FD00FB2